MKKLLAIGLSTLLLIGLFGCKAAPEGNDTTGGTQSTENQPIVDDNLLTVDINIPASMFEGSPPSGELTQEEKDKGFQSVTINGDGSVTYTMSKKAFREYKEETEKATLESLNKLPEEFSSIKSVECNDNFSKITLKADKASYENGMDFMCLLTVGMLANFCQAYTGEEIKSVIDVVDDATGEVFSSAEYPITSE